MGQFDRRREIMASKKATKKLKKSKKLAKTKPLTIYPIGTDPGSAEV